MITRDPTPRYAAQPVVVRDFTLPFLEFRAFGLPITQGSKDPILIRTKDGGVRPGMKESGGVRLKTWRGSVTEYAMVARGGPVAPVDDPVRVDLMFYLPRPVAEPKRRRTWPKRKPDLDKLVRAVFDSLTDAQVWKDDGRVVELHAKKDFATDEEPPGVFVRMWRMPEEVYPKVTPPPVKTPLMPGTEALPGL